MDPCVRSDGGVEYGPVGKSMHIVVDLPHTTSPTWPSRLPPKLPTQRSQLLPLFSAHIHFPKQLRSLLVDSPANTLLHTLLHLESTPPTSITVPPLPRTSALCFSSRWAAAKIARLRARTPSSPSAPSASGSPSSTRTAFTSSPALASMNRRTSLRKSGPSLLSNPDSQRSPS